MLKPLLKLKETGEEVVQSPGGSPSPGSQSQHDLGFVKLLVDEIEARHHRPEPDPHSSTNPNPNPNPNPRRGTNCSTLTFILTLTLTLT